MYSLAVVAGLLKSKPFDYALVIVLMVGYVYYVRRHFLTETPRTIRTPVRTSVRSTSGGGCGSCCGPLAGVDEERPAARRRSFRSRSRSAIDRRWARRSSSAP
jgi:hypothetical protein